MFAYKTAKHWGRGPRQWNSHNLDFAVLNYSSPLPLASMAETTSPQPIQSPGHFKATTPVKIPSPTTLCRWSIHCDPDAIIYENDDESYKDPAPPSPEYEDSRDETSWHEWPETWQKPDFPERLVQGLRTNNFSSIENQNLPLALSNPLESAIQDKNALLEESLGFAICGANLDLVREILGKMKKERLKCTRIYPLHLAASYVNGARSCCLIWEELLQSGCCGKPSDLNDVGHNSFDSIMITILRSHSSISPGAVDQAFKHEGRLPGGEVDICGRWDADSECYRQLTSSGITLIPVDWKHKFCHTSIQTICHNLAHLFIFNWATLNSSSGLFVQRCEHCGSKLELPSLHKAVLVASYLAENGLDGEDLFGMLAVILQVLFLILGCNFNGFQDAEYVPLGYLFLDQAQDDNGCQHRRMSACDFADSLSSSVWQQWTPEAITGWNLIRHVLRSTISKHADEICFPDCMHDRFSLGHEVAKLWESVQTELLTYRRIKNTDPWISKNFNMQTALLSLSSDDMNMSAGPMTDIPLVRPICDCGAIDDSRGSWDFPCAQDVCTEYFSNLEDDYSLCNIIEPTGP